LVYVAAASGVGLILTGFGLAMRSRKDSEEQYSQRGFSNPGYKGDDGFNGPSFNGTRTAAMPVPPPGNRFFAAASAVGGNFMRFSSSLRYYGNSGGASNSNAQIAAHPVGPNVLNVKPAVAAVAVPVLPVATSPSRPWVQPSPEWGAPSSNAPAHANGERRGGGGKTQLFTTISNIPPPMGFSPRKRPPGM